MEAVLGIDVGKTNVRVGVFRSDMTLVERWSVTSTDVPAAQVALRDRLAFLREAYAITGAGISIFGPLQVDPAAEDYGALIESSEPAWSNVNIPELVSSVLRLPVYFDFDVNAGALAEARLGAGRGVKSFLFLSVGTGIGGAMVRGATTPGFAPQIGHMYVPREVDDLAFEGSCRFHGGCLQGLASGKAIEKRWGRPAEELGAQHPAWDLEARYLARACANLVYTFSPEAIVMGASVSTVANLVENVNERLIPLLNDFLEPALRVQFKTFQPVRLAASGPDASLIGAAIMARSEAGLRLSSGS